MPLTLGGTTGGAEAIPYAARLVDVDGDGDLDIVATVIVFGPHYLVTWKNDGGGRFTLGDAVAYPSSIMDAIETADLDRDGDVDVVLSTGMVASVYLNDGVGHFAKFGLSYPLAEGAGITVTIADVDRDHFADLVAVNLGLLEDGELRVFLSHHDGSFGLPSTNGTTLAVPNVVMPMPPFTQASANPVVEDLNADGFVDLVVDDAPNERLLYFKGNGKASWKNRPTILEAGYFPTEAKTSDIDLDGDSDLVAVDRMLGVLVVLENIGGEFAPPVFPASLVYPGSLGMADLNNDCYPDAFSGDGRSAYLSVMLNQGDGSFAEPVNYSVAAILGDNQVGDVDGDGDLDLVAAGPTTPEGAQRKAGVLTITRNLGNGEFWAPNAYDAFASADGLASGDFDADGRADFAFGGKVLFGSAAGGFDPLRALDATSSASCRYCGAQVVDLNADGLPDVLQNGTDAAAFISQGDRTFTRSWTSPTTTSLGDLGLGHLNKDAFWDFVASESGSLYHLVFYGVPSNTFSRGANTPWTWPDLVSLKAPKLVDLNRDGADEILVPNFGSSGSALGVAINNGDGTSFTKKFYALPAAPQDLSVADYTGDGKLDAVVSVDSGAVVVFPGKADGALLASAAYPVGSSPGRIASADFDGDGDLDLVLASGETYGFSVTHVENAGKGVFSKSMQLLDASGASRIVTADLEGDGDPDFAVLNSGTKTLTTFENRQLTEDPAQSHPAVCDLCPQDKNKAVPGVCGCGVADVDTDDDGVLDCKDACPQDVSKLKPGVCGCGISDRDSDADGKSDCVDGCPQDPRKTAAGACGCGVVDVDTDLDGTADCHDACPLDVTKTAPGTCGCGVADIDSDVDKSADCVDGCPADAAKTSPGLCGCGTPDDDADLDKTPDCHDGCALDPLKVRAGACGCGTPDTDTDGDSWPDCVDPCPSTPGTCSGSGGESPVGSGGAAGEAPSNGGTAGDAGASANESGGGGAGVDGGVGSSGGGGEPTQMNEAGSASVAGGTPPAPPFATPTGTQVPPRDSSGCDCSTASASRTSPLGLLPLALLTLLRRRRAARDARPASLGARA